jgi:hypothetical protein
MLHRPTRLLAVAFLATFVAGCAGFQWPGGGVQPDAPDARPNPGNGGGAVGGGGAAGNPGVGVDLPAPDPNGGGNDPLAGMKPSIEVPQPGTVDPHDMSVVQITPNVDGRHVQVLLAWWGGVAPCSILDSVDVQRDGTTITMTPREGADPNAGEVACPAIAALKGTVVDLGELEPGTYTLIASGDLAPIQVTVGG